MKLSKVHIKQLGNKILCLALIMICCACKNQVSPDSFFKALTQTLDQDSLRVSGSYGSPLAEQSFVLNYDQTSKEMIYQSETETVYILNQTVYTDQNGTTWKEPLENSSWEKFSLKSFNPFVAVSQSERQQLFDSVTESNGTYTLVFNPAKLSALLDDYGAVSVSKGEMKARIDGTFLKELQFSLEGDLAIGEGSSFTFSGTLSFSSPAAFDFPDNLKDYPEGSQINAG